jgi:hypothetical protein
MEALEAQDQDFQRWSACEFNGHNFVSDEDNPRHHVCTNCGMSYDEDAGE